MCMAAGDKSAYEAEKRERERQEQINAGRAAIDQKFSVFNDSYFDEAEKDYLNYYNPQVDKQFNEAREQLVYLLSNNGNLNSSTGAKKFGELADNRSLRESELANRALGFRNDLRGNIERARNELYTQNSAAANPSAMASAASQRANMLTQPQEYSPLGDLFSQFITQAGNRIKVNNNKEIEGITPLQFSQPASGSMRVVG